MEDYIFSNTKQLDDALTGAVSTLLQKALFKKNKAVLVVSGGTTPLKLFQNLSLEDLDWAKITVLLADERWVAPTSERSNEKLVREILLQNKASEAEFIPYFDPGVPAERKAEMLNQDPGFLRDSVDVMILGMGEDGHTASLFPDAENTKSIMDREGNNKVLPVTAPSVPEQRITLTFPVLIEAHNLFLHFTGALKREVLQKACSGQVVLPVGQVLQQAKGTASIYWAA
ncbi:MAG: 6-phosphogluconolactonase [Sneathiellales bacterium]|nr:6-phosphogluconolactonase [Sneathiellales bacterium]